MTLDTEYGELSQRLMELSELLLNSKDEQERSITMAECKSIREALSVKEISIIQSVQNNPPIHLNPFDELNEKIKSTVKNGRKVHPM